MTETVRTAAPADADALTSMFVNAFLDTPDAVWLVPDRAARAEIYRAYGGALLAGVLPYGLVTAVSGTDGAAVWLPPAEDSDSAAMIAEVAGGYAERFALLAKTLAEHHPSGDHDYLAYLGVRPDRQGQGLGSALLAHHGTLLDAAGRAAYLVATTARSRDLYLRHGYAVRSLFHLPLAGPPMWGMWREPGSVS